MLCTDGPRDGAADLHAGSPGIGHLRAGEHAGRTTPRSSSTPPARPASRRAPCTRTASCSATCRASSQPRLFPRAGDLFWTPADWAWIGGLLDVSCRPASRRAGAGAPVREVRPRGGVPADREHGVRNAFMPPTALSMMRAGDPPGDRDIALRTVASGGETLGASCWMGPGGLRPHHQRVLRPDRVQHRGRLLRALMPRRSPARSGRPVPGHACGHRRRRHGRCAGDARRRSPCGGRIR